MLKRAMGLAIVVLAMWGCTSAPPPEEPPQWSAIKFVPQESEKDQDHATGQQIRR